MATELKLNGVRYAIGKLSAMQQFHVSRRIAPIIPPMIPVLLQFYDEMDKTAVTPADEKQDVLTLVNSVAPVLQPFADALAGLKDEDAEYVFGTCLSVVERWQGAGWAKVWNIAHKTSMFDDIGIDVMLPLVVRVVVANLGPFYQRAAYQPSEQPGGDVGWIRTLPGGEDWLLAPVHAQMCRYESLLDGALGLADVALMNDSLAVRADNEAAYRRKMERENG